MLVSRNSFDIKSIRGRLLSSFLIDSGEDFFLSGWKKYINLTFDPRHVLASATPRILSRIKRSFFSNNWPNVNFNDSSIPYFALDDSSEYFCVKPFFSVIKGDENALIGSCIGGKSGGLLWSMQFLITSFHILTCHCSRDFSEFFFVNEWKGNWNRVKGRERERRGRGVVVLLLLSPVGYNGFWMIHRKAWRNGLWRERKEGNCFASLKTDQR